ncbi:hypothetical protein GCM10028801_36050 [Nocardioides maradonensis]
MSGSAYLGDRPGYSEYLAEQAALARVESSRIQHPAGSDRPLRHVVFEDGPVEISRTARGVTLQMSDGSTKRLHDGVLVTYSDGSRTYLHQQPVFDRGTERTELQWVAVPLPPVEPIE